MPSSSSSSSRVIDWRVTLDKWDELALRVGQWKIDYNRERVDSSGRQQFVERSIVNRQFTIDRQVGVQLRGRLFKETPADLRYYVGAFTGEGRGVRNDDEDLMWAWVDCNGTSLVAILKLETNGRRIYGITHRDPLIWRSDKQRPLHPLVIQWLRQS